MRIPANSNAKLYRKQSAHLFSHDSSEKSFGSCSVSVISSAPPFAATRSGRGVMGQNPGVAAVLLGLPLLHAPLLQGLVTRNDSEE